MLNSLFRGGVVASLLASTLALSLPELKAGSLAKRQNTTSDRLVFCHFMIGIVGDRTSAADYDDDMKRAKDIGIDAFALNIGVDGYTDQQLNYAYESAANNDMKVFISFDFNWFSTGDASTVGNKIATYASKPAQLMVDNKAFASSFAGDGLDVAAMRSAAGIDVFFAPNFHPEQAGFDDVDAALNWLAWDNNGNNKAPTAGNNVTVEDGDDAYTSALGDKPYIAPVSPWFSTHFGPEVSFSKNWVFPGDSLWFDRWTEILTTNYQYLEIITWNDYGESHYIGRLDSKHYDDGNSKWTWDMPHDAWLDMAKTYIAAFKAGAQTVDDSITDDKLYYWYRPTSYTLDCDATDTTMQPANNDSGNYFMGRPDGYESMQDAVFVVTHLTEAATVEVTAGNNTQSIDAPAGAAINAVPFSAGKVSFKVSRGGSEVLSGASPRDIEDTCPCGIYNFNAYTGMLPAESSEDELLADGYASISSGLASGVTCGPGASSTAGAMRVKRTATAPAVAAKPTA